MSLFLYIAGGFVAGIGIGLLIIVGVEKLANALNLEPLGRMALWAVTTIALGLLFVVAGGIAA